MESENKGLIVTPSLGEQEKGLANQILAGNPQKVVWSVGLWDLN